MLDWVLWAATDSSQIGGRRAGFEACKRITQKRFFSPAQTRGQSEEWHREYLNHEISGSFAFRLSNWPQLEFAGLSCLARANGQRFCMRLRPIASH